jgi:hypothetical protein
MKKQLRMLPLLLFAVITLSCFSQNDVTVMIMYMKVKPGDTDKYLELEKEWTKIHRARLEKGYITGWQLWQKMYTGTDDEYQYIVIDWYRDFLSTDQTGYREVVNELYSQKQIEELTDRTLDARKAVRVDVMHRVVNASMTKPTAYITVSQMKVKPGMEDEYLKMERDIFKPIHEEAIRTGQMSTWSVWFKWPFEEGDYQYVVVNGFKDFADLVNLNYGDLFKAVYPDMDTGELKEKMPDIRRNTGVQVWRLVDAVMPESGHE